MSREEKKLALNVAFHLRSKRVSKKWTTYWTYSANTKIIARRDGNDSNFLRKDRFPQQYLNDLIECVHKHQNGLKIEKHIWSQNSIDSS